VNPNLKPNSVKPNPAQSPTQQSMPKLKADASVNPMGAAL
jgi:hypothetical protein